MDDKDFAQECESIQAFFDRVEDGFYELSTERLQRLAYIFCYADMAKLYVKDIPGYVDIAIQTYVGKFSDEVTDRLRALEARQDVAWNAEESALLEDLAGTFIDTIHADELSEEDLLELVNQLDGLERIAALYPRAQA